MARYTEAVCRQCRREGQKLFLKGDRCYTQKCAMECRAFAPGMHGQSRSKDKDFFHGIIPPLKEYTQAFLR